MKRRDLCIGITIICLMTISVYLSGCAVGFYRGKPSDKVKITELQDELQQLRDAKSMLEEKLGREINDKSVRVNLEDKGLVITFVAEVLFGSGKSQIKPEGQEMLNKVARVLKKITPDNEIGIEGHTDNVPIKYSGYKSNWELSTARATEVLHYVVDTGGLNPGKLAATGYGKYRPIVSNDTEEGRQQNRRVEIIIKPMADEKVKPSEPVDYNSNYIK